MSFYVRREREDPSSGERRVGWCGGSWMRTRSRAEREAAAWRAAGWSAEIHENTEEVRRTVRAWQRRAKGYPGQATTGGAA